VLFSVGLLAVALVSSSCRSGGGESEGEPTPSPAAPPAEEVECSFDRATRSLVTLNLEASDGTCTIVLPAEPRVGTLQVRVAVAGRDDAAAVQIRASRDAYYYANEGTVTIEHIGDGTIRGHFLVSDSNPPEVGGPFRSDFSVPLGSE
jgi:hypothetical protein